MLQALCDQTVAVLKRLVDESAPRVLESDVLPPVAQESLQHWYRCKHVAADFFLCQQQLQQLRDYIMGYSDRPLVLYGPSGCGKTKLVSKLALEVSQLFLSFKTHKRLK